MAEPRRLFDDEREQWSLRHTTLPAVPLVRGANPVGRRLFYNLWDDGPVPAELAFVKHVSRQQCVIQCGEHNAWLHVEGGQAHGGEGQVSFLGHVRAFICASLNPHGLPRGPQER